jgi:hypothetical protein
MPTISFLDNIVNPDLHLLIFSKHQSLVVTMLAWHLHNSQRKCLHLARTNTSHTEFKVFLSDFPKGGGGTQGVIGQQRGGNDAGKPLSYLPAANDESRL